MRKEKIIPIDIDAKTKKDFKVKELTVREIISLSQVNPLFAADTQPGAETAGKQPDSTPEGPKRAKAPGKDPGKPVSEEKTGGLIQQLAGDISDFSAAARGVIEASCDFKLSDLLDLPPSDIELVFKGWQEVNQTFLLCLEKVGMLDAVMAIIKGVISDFSETLVIS